MEILLITHSRGGIPQKLHETESLDVPRMAARLREDGHAVSILTHAGLLALRPAEIKGRVIVYASSQYQAYFQYIEDCLMYADACGGLLVPRFPLFRSHENKFLQELIKRQLGLAGPAARLIGTIEDLHECLTQLHFPLVLKTPGGFGSSGVSKIHSEAELIAATEAILAPIIPPASNPIRRLKQWRSHRLRIASYESKYPLRAGRLVLQEFLEGLTHDWKILVFDEACFCLKRYVRDGDFRASGSGKFSLDDEPSPALLDFALDVVRRLDTPWASLDIAEVPNGFALIEFQCVHFGLYTLTINRRCHIKRESGWVSQQVEEPSCEEYFCEALLSYVQRPQKTENQS